MDWKGVAGIALATAIAGLLMGLVIGTRGCGDGSVNKLLQENAELKTQVTHHRFIARQAEKERAQQAERRNTAERVVGRLEAKQAASAATIKDLQTKVAKAGRKRDERDTLIDALTLENGAKDEQINWLKAALDASKSETTFAMDAEHAINQALVASEERADKLEKAVMKDRRKKILIGVGSSIGGAGVMALAVYGAGKL
jgi:chromosome segregation ATPase